MAKSHSTMAKKYYVVWQGRETGIFTDWDSCKTQVDKFAGAKYKSFKTRDEAEAAFLGRTSPSARVKKTTTVHSSKAKSPKKRVKTFSPDEVGELAVDTKIFTDGGCDPNPGRAGSGIAVYRDDKLDEMWCGLYNPFGTNNTAELNALNQALIMAKEETDSARSVAIFCDSKYSIQCVTQWATGWEKRGWKKATGEIKNLELIKELYARYLTLQGKILVLHVNGHVGVEGNELADRMSIVAIDAQITDFQRYDDKLNVAAILRLRSG